ncbi:MAG: ATP synthase F1 subunit epsilon [Candidatus Gastranaerophilales bacterium]|nr:ATP synthase F1 subunit epsilon [Candidatus Gastranaerophilales bacterium]
MIKIKIITQNKVVFEGEADSFYTDTKDGRIGILPNHIPLTSVLEIGVTKIVTGNEPVYVTTMGGIMHFRDNHAVILTDIAELGSDIDEMRAHEAMKRAKAKIQSHSDKLSVLKAQVALKKAIARISATRKYY